MEEDKKGNGRKGLLATIIILCAVVIVIAVVVVALNIKQNKQPGEQKPPEETEEVVLPEELTEENLSAEDQVIKDTTLMIADSSKTNEDIEGYYDSVIQKALNDKNTDLAMRIIVQKMEFLAFTEGDCDKAKGYIDSIDLSPYSISEKKYISSYAISLATDCENRELHDRWIKIYDGTGE